jgi:hypothetical protein
VKKQVLIVCAIAALLFCLTAAPASAQSKGKCTAWYWDWSGTGSSYLGPAYIWLDANGTFQNNYGETGTWYEYKGARVLIFPDHPSFWAGKKNIGYMYMTDNSYAGYLPGLWYNKGAKKTYCNFVATGVQVMQDGPSMASPE